MSAECSRCGQDLVYPIGFPMVGVCVGCTATDERDDIAAERDRYKRALEEIADGPERHHPGAVIKIAKGALGHRASPSSQARKDDDG